VLDAAPFPDQLRADHGAVMIAFNNDIADGWQRADEPDYPQEPSTLAIRLGVNFAVYAMTH
jgi:hypothetical protein